jgi:hypothetical protein
VNVFLSHLNFMPFMYGIVLFVSTALIIKNVMSGQIVRAAGVALCIWVGFKMHGEAADTRMAVAIAALLLDLAWPLLFRRRSS